MGDEKTVTSAAAAETETYLPSPEFVALARIRSRADYDRLYRESLDSPTTFWRREAADIVWRNPGHELLQWSEPHANWFVGSELNVTETCLDRHLGTEREHKTALLFEAEDGEVRRYSYRELHDEVIRLTATLRGLGLRRGERVAIYMGMVPEVVFAILACARIGAPHTVVFGGFAAEPLRDRINDCEAAFVLTQDGAFRKGAVVPLKATVDDALSNTPSVRTVLVLRRAGQERCPIRMEADRDIDWHDALAARADSASGAAEIVSGDHPLFILYTSGSTGKPKGVHHTCAGYFVGAHVTTKYVFDLRADDVYWCTADVGWITGHSYVVYGPLSNGATCLIYEGAPNQPDFGRFWSIIERHKVTVLYTAPTAIRAFIRAGDDFVAPYDLSSLRLLGSVGEPINPEAWRWYYTKIGRERCPIVDTWWQTETGSILMTTLPGVHGMRPGSCGLPFFGVEPAIVTPTGEAVPDGESGLLVITRPWPSMLTTIWGDDERFKRQYFSEIPHVYFTGDGARRESDGYFTVIGRVDDVLNVSGHRIGTAEIESCLVGHPAVAEAAAVGRPDDLTGQALIVFLTLKPGHAPTGALSMELAGHVGKEIGKFARPARVVLVDGLPKTRSGKIMRRLLKSIAAGQDLSGDLSTLEDRSVVERCQEAFNR
jgi:acetyl-CoA synthetase